MRSVTVYTPAFCPYCSRAVALLRGKGADVQVIDATGDHRKRDEMVNRSGRWTFPQIFVGDVHVGGCEDLHALERAGRLDPLLAVA